MKIDFLKIKPGFVPPKGNKEAFNAYISSIEYLVKEMIPERLFELEVTPPNFLSYESYFQKLCESLPIIKWSSIDEAPSTLSLTLLCKAEYMHGTGRFFIDTVARTLIPGKQLSITAIHSLNFCFIIYPKDAYFITELCISIENERDLHIIQHNLPKLSEEIRLSLLATEHARKLVLTKSLSLDEKRMLLAENLSSLMKLPENERDHTILEETHDLLLKVAKQEKTQHIPDHYFSLIQDKPRAFDHNIFQQIQSLFFMFGETMIVKRDVQHLYRTISYLYLFRKIMEHRLISNSKEHYISLKILRTFVREKQEKIPVLAILICVNSVKENDALDIEGLKQTLLSHLNDSELIESSFLKSQTDREKISTLYLEMKRKDHQPFTHEDMKSLKKKLPKEILSLIRPVTPLVIHEAHEEEITRNILTLSKELKTPQDIPPLIILFSDENSETMTFIAILVSLDRGQIPTLIGNEKRHLKTLSHQTKIAGILNQRYLQKAHILTLEVSKTIAHNLYEGRKLILNHLKAHFGNVRDYNGGMIVKQYETLSSLKKLLQDNPSDLIEKYFYSLAPGMMQTLLSSKTLEKHFLMLLESIHSCGTDEPYRILTDTTEQELCIMISSQSDELVTQIKKATSTLISSSADLATCDLKVGSQRHLGLILAMENKAFKEEFPKQLESMIMMELSLNLSK